MSELIAEARVLVTPDTTAFRSQLIAQTAAAAKGVIVPVQVTPVVSGATGTVAAQQELAAGAAIAAASEKRLASEVEGAAAAERTAARAAAQHSRELGNLSRGASATGLSFLGLRGATLAASGAFIGGAAGAIAFSKAIKLAVDFQTQLNTFQVVAGATADQMQRVSETAQDLGRDVSLPGVSAADAAQAFTELSKAGLDVQDSLDGARGVLQLATAAGLDNAQATELAASALNAFGLAGDQAVHVADVLANAANDAQGSITDIGIALQQASAAGRQAGLSLEQTTAILTEFARNGIKGSDAGTLLRTLLIRLINPTDKAAKVIKELGLNLRDASGAIDVGVFQQFADATRNLTPAARDQAAAIIAGQDAFRGLSILAREGGAALDAQTESLNKSGTAAAVAGAKMKGLAGDANALQSNLETLGISIGTVLLPALGSLARGANDIVAGFQKASDAFRSFIGDTEFDRANANLDELSQHLSDLDKQVDDFRRSNSSGFLPPSLTEDQAALVKQIREIGKSLNETPAGFQKFVRIVTAASPQIKAAMEDGVITPLEKAELQTTALGRAFVAALPRTTFTGLGAAIRSGIEDAGARAKVAVADLGAEVRSGIEDAARQAVQAAAAFEDVGPAIQQHLASAGAAAVSALNLAVAQASGNQSRELAILRQQEARREAFLNNLLSRQQTPKTVALATKAAQNLEQTRRQIDGILAQQAADAAAQSAKVKQNAALVKKNADDAQRAAAAAAAAIIAAAQATATAFQTRLSAVQAGGATQNTLLAILDREAARLKAAIVRARGNKALADELRGELRDIRETREQTENDLVQARLAFGQSVLDLTGNRNPLLNAIDAAIAEATADRKAAKKGSVAWLEAQTEINNLLAQRKDALRSAENAAKEAARGFTSFDALQKAQGFSASLLGNLIPGFATGGLVGNISAAAPITDPRTANRPTGLAEGLGLNTVNARGVRPVQVDTTNALLRQILAALHGRNTQPPEARFNRRTSFSMMDTL